MAPLEVGQRLVELRRPGAVGGPDALDRNGPPRFRGRLWRRELLREGRPRGEGHVAPCRRPQPDVHADIRVDAGVACARDDAAVAGEVAGELRRLGETRDHV
eukprot:9160364-Alexandrium_andersonii.AAC.1